MVEVANGITIWGFATTGKVKLQRPFRQPIIEWQKQKLLLDRKKNLKKLLDGKK